MVGHSTYRQHILLSARLHLNHSHTCERNSALTLYGAESLW